MLFWASGAAKGHPVNGYPGQDFVCSQNSNLIQNNDKTD